MLTITELTPAERPAWDSYVQQSPHGLPLHLAGWQDVLRQTHGYETRFLLAREAGQIVGVLPLFLVRSRLLGHTATSMPGGLCADTPAGAQALLSAAQTIARQAGIRRLRLQDTRQVWPGPLQNSCHHEHWLVDTSMGTGALWQKLDGNIRRQVRIGRKNDLRVEIDRTGRLLDDFYDVFRRFTHQSGTPVFGRDFLANVVHAFPTGHNIAVIYQGTQPIGGYFQLEMPPLMLGMWGASLRDYLPLRPVYLGLWSILEDAANRGFSHLDMGRSPAGSNASHFKGQWGGVCAPVHQQLMHINRRPGAAAPAPDIQSDGKMQLFMRLWPRLPLPVAQFLGPRLRRHIPFA